MEKLNKEDFLKPITDTEEIGRIKCISDQFKNSRYILVIGIGGSDLASKAIWSALTTHTKTEKKMIFLESADMREYEEVSEIVNEINKKEEIVIIVTSKSGKTLETLDTFNKIFDIISEKFGAPINDRVIIISSLDSPLYHTAVGRNFIKVSWPDEVGGRFSAFTIAHTLPIAIAGLDVYKYFEGGKAADIDFAKKLATRLYQSIQAGVDIWDFFLFNTELEDVGKWARQLVAESLATITPTVSIGPSDLHSQLELYLGGPKNRFTLFIRSSRELSEVSRDAYENAVEAFRVANLPFEKFEVDKISESMVGEFFALMMFTVVELAKLLNVDPYDQPAVDNYKLEILNSKSETN